MTSQLLILGNGFDLHCGLQSSYKSFFRQEILDTTTVNFGVIQLKAGVTGFWEKLLLEYYKIDKKTDYKWCDIEAIIKDTLWLIYFGEDYNSVDINRGMWKNALLYTEFGYVDPEAQYINEHPYKFIWAYCVDFIDSLTTQEQNYSEQEKLHSFTKYLLKELHNFERRFCKYIKKNVVNPDNEKELNIKYIVNAVNLLAKLTGCSQKHYNGIDDFVIQEFSRDYMGRSVKVMTSEFSRLNSTSILSFNYTTIFDLLDVKSPCSYSNVHGKLCKNLCAENCKSSNIIFGIDDNIIQAQGEYNDLRLFSKTYRKMFAMNTPENVLPRNDKPVDIKFYGHSLSEADYSYFQSIFDYYNLYSNNDVSLIFYYSEKYDPTDAVYRLINEYGKTLTNKDQGKNLMHKLLLENRIKIVKI